MGYETIMLNCNPETVSTDYTIADKLYFEPLDFEHVRQILDLEKPKGVIVQLGGQTALKLAKQLHEHGYPLMGTSFDALDLAEDRGRFSSLLAEMNIPYPEFAVAKSVDDAIEIANEIGFPLLVRPSYVIGGQSMKIVINPQELTKHVLEIFRIMPDNKVLLDRFLENAMEAEADAICDGEEVRILGVMQHLEPAGIHSGDSHSVLPPYSLGPIHIQQIEELTKAISLKMQVKGLLNVQFAIKDDVVYVIEANPRASRTVPFIAKAYRKPYVKYAVKCMLGAKVRDFDFDHKTKGYAIKEPVFSYNKFPEIQKELGPEMKSTGEAIYFVKDLKDSYFRKLYSERNLYLSR
jgi:carbamoyl-phosphate synthase large subunit